jgi:hypothetical protein
VRHRFRAAEKEKMYRREEQVRPSLADGSFANQRQHLRIVGHAAADGVMGGGPIAGGSPRKDPELFGEG